MILFYSFIFCAAIRYLFIGTENIKDLQKALYAMGSEVYEEDFKAIDEIVVKRSDIIAALMAEHIDYDIEAAGILYEKANHNFMSVKEHLIKEAEYKKEYILSQSGKVLKVIFTE